MPSKPPPRKGSVGTDPFQTDPAIAAATPARSSRPPTPSVVEIPEMPGDPHAATERPPSGSKLAAAPPSPPPPESRPPPQTVRGHGSLPSSPSGWPSPEPSSDSRRAAFSVDRETEPSMAIPKSINADRAMLTTLTGFNAGQMFALDQPEHVMGRGTEADVWAEDPAISRRHAKVTHPSDGIYIIEDLGSTNGTFVNGTRLAAPVELEDGDRLQLGPNLQFRFSCVDDTEEELQRRLYESSTRDALTRTFNRKYFSERLAAEVAHARRHKTQLALLMLDLDEFKKMNDLHGHLAGDMVLRVVAARVARLIRVDDVLARYGGEEFVILARATPHKDAVRLAERTRREIAALTIAARDVSLTITASIGVATMAELGVESGGTELLALADARLYRAKVGGRNRVESEG